MASVLVQGREQIFEIEELKVPWQEKLPGGGFMKRGASAMEQARCAGVAPRLHRLARRRSDALAPQMRRVEGARRNRGEE